MIGPFYHNSRCFIIITMHCNKSAGENRAHDRAWLFISAHENSFVSEDLRPSSGRVRKNRRLTDTGEQREASDSREMKALEKILACTRLFASMPDIREDTYYAQFLMDDMYGEVRECPPQIFRLHDREHSDQSPHT